MGRVDLFHSRRTNYNKCVYWIRQEQNTSPSQWVAKNEPSGKFWAKPVSPKTNQGDVINGVWRVDKNHISLETDDDIEDLTQGCIVKYNEALWLVENVQGEIHNKESEFSKKIDYRYTIYLTRGKK